MVLGAFLETFCDPHLSLVPVTTPGAVYACVGSDFLDARLHVFFVAVTRGHVTFGRAVSDEVNRAFVGKQLHRWQSLVVEVTGGSDVFRAGLVSGRAGLDKGRWLADSRYDGQVGPVTAADVPHALAVSQARGGSVAQSAHVTRWTRPLRGRRPLNFRPRCGTESRLMLQPMTFVR